ncbi:rhodanese-like domain-containing protein [Oceanibacterium hippocampi]|nr:rhodanese-like domain-containing protein [Oceanibacterium hippocampi]
MRTIEPAALKAAIGTGDELAFLDVREHGQHAAGHPFFARSLPLSRLEWRAPVLLPRRSVPIVLFDSGAADDDIAARAAVALDRLGYSDIRILAGGAAGWQAAGYELFSGVNVPSKAFGEFVESRAETPRISARELNEAIAAGEDIVILDSRPWEEYHRMAIPGGIDCPGAELVLRGAALAPSDTTRIVVNCAGRTRSIIGAQSLIDAGLPNPVMALENGTMGWHLAGLEVVRGADRVAPLPDAADRAAAQARAARVRARFGVPLVGPEMLAAWQAQAEVRSFCLLDVRSPDEFLAGHLAGSRNAPGGQLVQATDEYVGTLNGRIMLVDDDGVRASMTASWLIRLGWPEVAVLKGGLDGDLVQGPVPPDIAPPEVPAIMPAALAECIDAGSPLTVLDVGTSLAYRRGHVPGALWTPRSRLAGALAHLAADGPVVVTADDPTLVAFAAADLAALVPGRDIRRLDGGTAAFAAIRPLETGLVAPLSETDDEWRKPYDQPGGIEERMREYLEWEVGLVAQIARDGDARFRHFD